MPITRKHILLLATLLVALLLLALPVQAQLEGKGHLVTATLSGTVTIDRLDGNDWIVDSDDMRLAVLTRGKNIIIDIVDAGVIDGTETRIVIEHPGAGIMSKDGNQIRFNISGTSELRFPNNDALPTIVIDHASAGIIARQGRNIGLQMRSVGAVQDTGEQIVIDIISSGVID